MIFDAIQEWFQELLIDGIISNLTGMFDTLNTKVGEIAGEVFGPDRVRVAATMTEAIEAAVQLADEAGPGAGVLIAGSVYAAGEARSLLVRHPDPAEGDA